MAGQVRTLKVGERDGVPAPWPFPHSRGAYGFIVRSSTIPDDEMKLTSSLSGGKKSTRGQDNLSEHIDDQVLLKSQGQAKGRWCCRLRPIELSTGKVASRSEISRPTGVQLQQYLQRTRRNGRKI